MHADASDAIIDRCRHAPVKNYGVDDETDTVSQSVCEMHL